ncbi:MAG: ribonuclease HII [Chloroflexi bacterium]|nr:MAG: ribonuclease HII [Chloroflexota bacterium]MBL1194456.1 ribonuclease HII [Chloroflexota bacterium]NOH11743.1 ribonuclease HII [Chloroflexota bacterium]
MPRRIDPSLIPSRPNLKYEKGLWQAGVEYVAGVDEAGRGALAGPVCAGAVMLPPKNSIFRQLKGVTDSKQMTAKQREFWAAEIKARAVSWGVGFASANEIDSIGIVPATRLAMGRAIEELDQFVEHLLIDALLLPEVSTPQTSLLKGDARSLSIACASVLAKVARDKVMIEMDNNYATYGFARHKGYGTRAHRTAIKQYGPSEMHRLTFRPIREE